MFWTLNTFCTMNQKNCTFPDVFVIHFHTVICNHSFCMQVHVLNTTLRCCFLLSSIFSLPNPLLHLSSSISGRELGSAAHAGAPHHHSHPANGPARRGPPPPSPPPSSPPLPPAARLRHGPPTPPYAAYLRGLPHALRWARPRAGC